MKENNLSAVVERDRASRRASSRFVVWSDRINSRLPHFAAMANGTLRRQAYTAPRR